MNKPKLAIFSFMILLLFLNQIPALEINYNGKNGLSENPTKVQEIIEMINESTIRKYLEELVSIGPRMTGSQGFKLAADYVRQQFNSFGLETRFQIWSSLGSYLPIKIYQCKNIEATLNGSFQDSEMIILSAHLDTVEVSPGANDDGSGVVALLVAAKILSQFEFNRTIKFVCFSGEELGLLGSRAYVEELYESGEELFIAFNADMIGYAETAEGGKTIRVYPSINAQWIKDKIKEINIENNINFNIKGDWILRPGLQRAGSDFYDFLQYDYDVITYFEEEFNRDYFHTVNDTIEHINFSYLVNTTKLIVGSLAYFADEEINYPQIRITKPRFGKLYFNNRSFFNLPYHRTIVINDILIETEVKQGNSPIKKVEFYYGDKLQFVDTNEPYSWTLDRFSCFIHRIKAIVYDQEGKTSIAEMTIPYLNFNTN